MHTQIRDTWIYFGFLALLWFAPLPLGSNRTWALGILFAWMLGLLVSALAVWARQPDQLLARLAHYRLPLILLGAYILWVILQFTPLPAALVRWMSPEAYAVQARVLAAPAWMTISLDPYQTRLYAGLAVFYAAAFMLALLLVRDARRLEGLALALVIGGVTQAIIGIALYSAGAKYQLFFEEFSQDRVRGTFVYHNSMAGYMELCLSMGIGLMLGRLGAGTTTLANTWKARWVAAMQFILSPKMLLRLMLVIMVIALVLTRSRMGNSAFFAAMAIVGVIGLTLSRRMAPATVWLIASLIVIDVLVIGSWVGLEKVVDRLQETAVMTNPEYREESVEQRSGPGMSALGIVSDFPLTGTGAGSFYTAFPRYRPGDIRAYFDHAHNDYVEIAADTGLAGLGLLLTFALLATAKGLYVLRRREYHLARGIAFGGLMAVTCIAIHSTVDFNLQIPANALTFVVILAALWIAAEVKSDSGRKPQASR